MSQRLGYPILRLNGRAYAVVDKLVLRLGPQQLRAWDLTGLIDDEITEVGLDVDDIGEPARLGVVGTAAWIDDPREECKGAVVQPAMAELWVTVG